MKYKSEVQTHEYFPVPARKRYARSSKKSGHRIDGRFQIAELSLNFISPTAASESGDRRSYALG